MDTFQNIPITVNRTINPILSPFTRSPLAGVLKLALVLYAGKWAPSLPPPVLRLFENAWFRFAIISLVAYTSNVSPSVAIALALATVVSLDLIAGRKLKQSLGLQAL
jgi:hypothetical protein